MLTYIVSTREFLGDMVGVPGRGLDSQFGFDGVVPDERLLRDRVIADAQRGPATRGFQRHADQAAADTEQSAETGPPAPSLTAALG